MKKILLALGLIVGLLGSKVYANELEDTLIQNIGLSHNISVALPNAQFNFGTLPSTGTIGLTLYYVGSSTQAVVTIGNTGIVNFYAPYNVPDLTVFPNSSFSVYDMSVSTSNTVGQFCAAVNQSASYRCVLNGLRSDNLGTLLNNYIESSSVGNLKSAGGFQVGVDSGGVQVPAAGVWGSTVTVMLAVGMNPMQQQHRVVLRKCVANLNDATGLQLRIYGEQRQYEGLESGPIAAPITFFSNGRSVNSNVPVQNLASNQTDATLVWAGTMTSGTDTTVDFTAGQSPGYGLEFAKGQHVVVQSGAYPGGQTGSSAGYASTNYLTCFWDEKP